MIRTPKATVNFDLYKTINLTPISEPTRGKLRYLSDPQLPRYDWVCWMNQRVELGSFYLSHPAQDGPARVSTALFLRSANGESITIQASDDLLQLLSSGEVWVARGSICSVDIHLRGLLGPGEILHLKTYDNVCKAIEEAEVSLQDPCKFAWC